MNSKARAKVPIRRKKPSGTKKKLGLEPLDSRTFTGQVVRALVQDQGGRESMSNARYSLTLRVAHIETLIALDEQALRDGKKLDVGVYRQNVNSLIGLYKVIGIDRRAKRLPSLTEYLGNDGKQS